MIFELNGARMYYERRGENGRPLVLLHGWGGSSESMTPIMRDLSDTHRVLAVDFPGHGKSPEPPSDWSVTEYCSVTYALLKNEGFEGADVIAHSFGGRVALLLASEHPEMVGRLLITGGAGIPNRPDNRLSARTRLYKLLRRLADNAFTRRAFGKKVDSWREALVQKFGSADYKALSPAMRRTFNRVLGQDLTGCLEKITSPTLLIWGENDTATPIWMGEKMEKEIKDAALIRFENAGHFAYLEKYPRFIAIAREFLK